MTPDEIRAQPLPDWLEELRITPDNQPPYTYIGPSSTWKYEDGKWRPQVWDDLTAAAQNLAAAVSYLSEVLDDA
jgi:hypothetical protein